MACTFALKDEFIQPRGGVGLCGGCCSPERQIKGTARSSLSEVRRLVPVHVGKQQGKKKCKLIIKTVFTEAMSKFM